MVYTPVYMSGKVITVGPVRSLRLPLAVDKALVDGAKRLGTSPARYAVRALTADLAGSTDREVTVTMTMSGRLFAALLKSGAIRSPDGEGVPDDPPLDGVPEAPLDGGASTVNDEITLSPVDLPSADELAARGGVGTVPGCDHRRSVPVGSLRKCAICAAVKGLDGEWRVG